MFGFRLRRGVLAVLGLVALLAAAASFAYAESGGRTIDACAKTGSGQLRLDTGAGCLPSEHAVQWNQVGPQGLPGPPGPTHVTERAWYHGIGGGIPVVSGVWPDVRPNLTNVLTMHLDAGNYAISAQLFAANNDGQGILVCLFGNDTLGYALAQAALGNAAGFAQQQNLEAQSTFALDSAQDLSLRCFNAPPNDPAGNPKVVYADVMATKVDTADFTLAP